MSRSRLGAGSLAFILVLTLGIALLSCKKAPAPPTPPARLINFNELIQQKNNAALQKQPLKTKGDFDRERSEVQDIILRAFQNDPPWFIKKITGVNRPYLFHAITDCERTMRVGDYDDGGKWVCDPHSLPEKTIVYSFGVGENISFDTDMASLFGAEVHMFDPAPSVAKNFRNFQSGQRCGPGRIYYQPLGLGPITSETDLVLEGKKCPQKTLTDIARSLGHDHLDILKIDIEGGEYGALKQMLSSGTLDSLRVKQLLIEFHFWDDALFKEFMETIGMLKKQGYILFHKEFNPQAADVCAEYAFVKIR